jgi:hypothetical protein
MVNIPARNVPDFDPERTLSALLEILRVQALQNDGTDERLVPTLLVLSAIAKGIARSRPIIKEVLFPGHELLRSPDGVRSVDFVIINCQSN